MDKRDELWPRGPCFYYDTALFPPGTDSFCLAYFARPSRGDTVCMVMPNIPEFTIAYFAILHLGAVVVPCNTLLTSCELAYQFAHADSRCVLTCPSCMAACW